MAPGVRSGRTGRPGAVGAGAAEPGGRPQRRTDAPGGRRCLRTGGRAGAAGMLSKRLLSVGMLLLLARRALAAEEKSTFDASGSSSLPGDPAAAPARPSADPSVAGEVPFSPVRSDGDPESEGEALSGRPAFSSVLTVMAGSGKHPASLDHSGTSPTVTRDESHTTQWPSHSFSQSPETSSSSDVEDGILPPNSGLTSTVLHLPGTPPPVVITPFNVAGPSPLSPPSSSSPLSSSAPSTSSSLPSFVSVFPLSPSAAWIKKAASSRGQRSAAASLGWSERLTTAQSGAPSELPLAFPSETSTERSNEVTNLHFHTPYHSQRLYEAAQNQRPGNLDISPSSPSSQERQGAERQQASPAPTAALPSAHPGHSASSHATEQTVNRTAYMETEGRAAADGPAHVLRISGDTVTSPLTSRVVNPDASPAIMLRPPGSFVTVSPDAPPGKASVLESARTKPAPVRLGPPPSAHASNPGDLPTAAGHDGPGVSAIDMNHDRGAAAADELEPTSTQASRNHSLPLTQTRPRSVGVSALGPITGAKTASHAPHSDSPGLPRGYGGFEPQTESLAHTSRVPAVLSTKVKTIYLSGSANEKSYRTSPARTSFFPSSVSHRPNHHTDDNAERSSLTTVSTPPSLFSHINTTSTTRSQGAVPPALSSYMTQHQRAGRSIHSTADVETSKGSEQTPTSASVHVSHKATAAGSSRSNPAPPGLLTTRFPSLTATKGVFTLSGSGRSPNEKHFTPAPLDVTLAGSYEPSPASSRSEIVSAPRADAASSSRGPIASVSGDRSGFYLGRQTSSPFTASSAAATSSSSRQSVTDTLRAIFSVGTKLMAPYTKWKATGPAPFQSRAFESHNTSTGFDGANSHFAADGSSYEQSKPGREPERNVLTLDSGDPALVTRVPHSGRPTVGERAPLAYAKGPTPEEQPASHGSQPLSGAAARSVTSSRASSSAPVQSGDPSMATLSNSPARAHQSPSPSSSHRVLVGPASSPHPSPGPSSPAHSDHWRRVTDAFVVPTEAEAGEGNAATSGAVALTFPKDQEAGPAPSDPGRVALPAGPTEGTSQVAPPSPRRDTTTASVELAAAAVDPSTTTRSATARMPSLSVSTATAPQPVSRRTTTTTTTTRSPTSRTQTSRRTFAPPLPRTSPPRAAGATFASPFTTTTEVPPPQCNITERMWVKTVVSIYVRRNRLDSIQRQNLRRGLSQGLRKALNDTSAQAQVETVFGSPNMTVAYHVTGGDVVYPPSVVLEALDSYGRDKLIADLRQYLPMVTALPLPAALWRPVPATGFQLKTVLQFVGAGDDSRTCRFSQMMELRLEKVFSEAQAKVLNTNGRLSVQMLSVSQAPGSPAVSLVYTVRNGSVLLNGTAASNLLGQLSAELVGYFLFYPPLIIAEPLEYHNLNTSIATRDLWVITVIQDVDNASLEAQYQSFASLMEQRLAELFVLASRQGTRFRRATTVGSYTVQMVSIRRVSGSKSPAEMTYYIQHNGIPLSGSSAAKILSTVDSQTMALTLGYFVQLQAEPVVKNPPNNLWIIAAVLAPIAVVTLIIIIITAVLCRKNKSDFKADAIGNLNPRAKMAYRRDVGYYHQPVQGFDYAKQHLGQQGGDEETLPVSQDTLVMSLQIRDQPLSLDKALQQDGTANKKSLCADKYKSKLPSEDGSVISNESEKPNSGRGLTAPKVTAQQKPTKEATRKRDDPYDTSSGSLQLVSIKPVAAQPSYSHPASSARSQDVAVVNGEVNLALKQKSDIEHYRNKLRLKAKRKGYYDFPSTDGSSSGPALVQRQRPGHERAAGEHGGPLEPDDERGSTYVKSHRRHSQVGQAAYRSRQSLSSPSPGGTEMDLLVMRERPRRGIRNSGYDTEPELIEETNVDRLMGPRGGYMYGRGLKGHSETSTLSSQPSIDEVRQQMHLLLEEAFSLASGGQSTSGRHSHHSQQHHHHHHHPTPDHYSPAPPPLPYTDVVTSAPGTMSSGRGGLQWIPSYGGDIYQCSLPKPAFRFTQLPEMTVGSPPPLPPRTGPSSGSSLRRSTSDLGLKGRTSKTSVPEMQSQRDNNPYGPTPRAALPSITAEQPVSNYSGNPITAVYAIPATRSGYSEYFVSTPPTSYHSPSWMSYPPEPEDVPPQWADSVPLPGYVEAFPHPRYPQGSPTRLPLEYNQSLEQPTIDPNTASQQGLPQSMKNMDSMPLSSLSTSALVQAIRQEVAKLAKKQNDMFEF